MKWIIKILTVLVFGLIFNFDLRSQNRLWNLDDIIFDGENFYSVVEGEARVVKIDTSGKIVSEISNQGRGPGEFSSPNIEIALIGENLYILDKRGYKIIRVNREDFSIKDEQVIKGNPIDLFGYDNKLFGFRIRPKTNGEGSKIDITEKYFTGEEIFNNDGGDNFLFRFEENQVLNPLYDQKIVKSINDDVTVVYYPYKSNFYIFIDDTLNLKSIPNIESKSLGNKIDKRYSSSPSIDKIFKFKFIPSYKLIKSIVNGVEPNTILIQLNSYKLGGALIEYNYLEQKFRELGEFSMGEVAGINNNFIFSYFENRILKTPINEIVRCSDYELGVYIKDIDEICDDCSDSLIQLYEETRTKHVPLSFYLKESGWFSRVDENDYKETVDFFIKKGVWGKVKFIDKCDECFKPASQLNVIFKDNNIETKLDAKNLQSLNEYITCF